MYWNYIITYSQFAIVCVDRLLQVHVYIYNRIVGNISNMLNI